ncbi:beta-ketoacyl synthase N-terminal-like domain-containing protein [Maribacter sp. 2210JD10-5]|uniref:beta-ketoacyl synthase N-terminal-like domain-containing protein n=1 Tax=Maribacter sp. 2210JD10-5 TaxID=3386272 RepID=UPI0039BCA38F
MNQPISITAMASISPLGSSSDVVWENYLKANHCFAQHDFKEESHWAASISEKDKMDVEELRNSEAKYTRLDNSVLYAILASREVVQNAGWSTNINFGINIGSSRGATGLFEKYHREFLETKNVSTPASPTTTLGNISSWVAHDLGTQGPDISHSITCSTALHSLLNGVAWLKAGMAEYFLVGGSEAPLTPFTIAQMKALKIYANPVTERSRSHKICDSVTEPFDSAQGTKSPNYPCRALDLEKNRNTMILGEGASVVCLEKGIPENSLAVIEGIGYATEPLEHNVSISTNADCFQRSMKMALGEIPPDSVDAIVMHAPGTIKGDLTEHNAIKKVFCNKLPFLTTNKWKVGHTFGASGMLSVELAVLMIQHQKAIKVPFISYSSEPMELKKIMVNAVGFGGNAVSILLSKIG